MNAILVIIFIVALSLFSSTVFRDIGIGMMINPDALMIVGGGTLISIFLGFPLKRLKRTGHYLLDAFRTKWDREGTTEDLLEIAKIHRRADIRGMERGIKRIKDDFLKLGANLLINNQTNDEIRTAMEKAMAIRMMDHHFSQNVLKTVARLTPSFGLAGTVISLIKMFNHMQSIESIAPHMAVAMMSTFYGVIIANLFMLPLSAKLEERSIQSEALMQSIIEGIEAINNREHPIQIEERINGYSDFGDIGPVRIGSLQAAVRGNDR
ncbi:MAG: MotA/TolQ/ExbB proton channel family protein [Nitrospirae bacterium]|nr:MotA/TolQ/ExbB proton channel family protein [Candidatus Manganitrophaceae bacterium]